MSDTDSLDNNIMHMIFDIDDKEMRYKFLSIALKENLGDLSSKNINGVLPH